MLTVHHLKISQSERIVWLCEELGIEYKLVLHTRDSNTQLSPESLTSLPGNDLAAAPLIQDGDVTLAESGAIVEYILAKYGHGKLALGPDDKDFPQYLYWFHFANGGLQTMFMLELVRRIGGLTEENPMGQFARFRFERVLSHLNDRLKNHKWLAGDQFTAADCMCAFSPSTNRHFVPVDLTPYPHVVRWLQDCGTRPAYQAAMAKADPGMERLLSEKGPEKSLLEP